MKIVRQMILGVIAVLFFLTSCAQAEEPMSEPVSPAQTSSDDYQQVAEPA